MLQAYSASVAADGSEGRMMMIFDGDGLEDHGRCHPAGDGLVVRLSDSVPVTGDVDGVPDRALLGPGEATSDPAGAGQVVDLEGPASVLAITAALGTDHRLRTCVRPTERVGTPSREEAP